MVSRLPRLMSSTRRRELYLELFAGVGGSGEGEEGEVLGAGERVIGMGGGVDEQGVRENGLLTPLSPLAATATTLTSIAPATPITCVPFLLHPLGFELTIWFLS